MTVEQVAAGPVKSKYTISDIPGGFLVQREGGLEVGVTYGETYIRVDTANVAIYQYPAMVDKVAEWFMDSMTKGYLNKRKREEGMAMIARALSKRMKPHWERLVKEFVPKEVGDLARLMWSSVHGDADILHKPELYTDAYKHLRGDLLKYHACRLIAKREETLGRRYDDEPLRLQLIDRMQHWRELYTRNVVSPKAFNKTLDKLPRALSFKMIDQLTNVHLEQPITNRLHLIAVLCGAEHFHWYMHERTVLSASPDMIQEAATLIGWNGLKPNARTSQVKDVVTYVMDYPAPFNGDFIGLARRSHEWHRDNYRTPDDARLPADTVLPLLALDYPALAEQGVQPLRTVGEVVEEGDVMHHCVGSYAHRASVGHSFLFHVEHNNQKATIELSAGGAVQQAYGPRNTINDACRWGSEALRSAVGKDLPQVIPAIPF